MADIKQAAKWMEAGRKVTRRGFNEDGSYFWTNGSFGFIHYWSKVLDRKMEDALEVQDLLADDWEIVQ
jgi:hypothetical protein